MSASLSRLLSFYSELKPELLLHAMIKREFNGSIALLTTLTAASEPLLQLAASISTGIPLLWLDHNLTTPEFVPQKLGFNHIVRITGKADTPALTAAIEDMTLLAIIMDIPPSPSTKRIELDDLGVFRIYPFAGIADTTSDWSV